MDKAIRITFEAKLKAGIKRDDRANVFVTYAPALDLYSQGETQLQAKAALRDAVQSFLILAYNKGVLHQLLKSCGFTPDSRQVDIAQVVGGEYINVVAEEILAQHHFEDVFEIPTSLPLTAVCA